MASSAPEPNAPAGAAPDELIGLLDAGRKRFLALVADVRPELHRYCTRMTGSVSDGEDVVQETLARAYFEVSQLTALPPLRPWLFRIAHNRVIDHWRHESHRAGEPLEAALDIAADAEQEPDALLARSQAVKAAISGFLALAPAQRGCVILKDVLEHSLEEIASELGLSVPAVKAALHRGRAALARLAAGPQPAPAVPATSPELRRYASLFNVRDWDGVRALLADDVRLDLVSQRKASGRRDVGVYFSNYDRTDDWRLAPARLGGREVLAVLQGTGGGTPRYFIEIDWREGRVTAIRDFRYVPYIAQDGAPEIEATEPVQGDPMDLTERRSP
jgi:RNA polymerase sigma-70 factor (ECF subfamily)